MLTGDPIDKHHNQSLNFEETDTDTSTNQQNNIFEIEASYDSDSEGSDDGGSALGGTSDTGDKVDPTLCF